MSLIVKCVKKHVSRIEDPGWIRTAGYIECCPYPGCMLKAWVWTGGETDADMDHLDAPAICPNCGYKLSGGDK